MACYDEEILAEVLGYMAFSSMPLFNFGGHVSRVI